MPDVRRITPRLQGWRQALPNDRWGAQRLPPGGIRHSGAAALAHGVVAVRCEANTSAVTCPPPPSSSSLLLGTYLSGTKRIGQASNHYTGFGPVANEAGQNTAAICFGL